MKFVNVVLVCFALSVVSLCAGDFSSMTVAEGKIQYAGGSYSSIKMLNGAAHVIDSDDITSIETVVDEDLGKIIVIHKGDNKSIICLNRVKSMNLNNGYIYLYF